MKLQVGMNNILPFYQVYLFTSFMATLMTVFSQIIMTLKALLLGSRVVWSSLYLFVFYFICKAPNSSSLHM